MQRLMNRRGESDFGMLMMIFIVVIVCLALFGSIINTQDLATEKQAITDENMSLSSCYATGSLKAEVNESASECNFTVSSAPTGWELTESVCAIGNVIVTNSTGAVLVSATDYNVFTQTGIVQFLNTTDTNRTGIGANNQTQIDYDFCDSGYNKDTSSRGIARLWGLFAALIILAAAIYGIREWAKQ